MILFLALITGILTTVGIFLLLRRSLVKVILGLAFLGHAANLLIFTIGRITKGKAAFVPEGLQSPFEPFADPLPQALILTAIVIGFGVQAFLIVLFKQNYKSLKSDDLDDMNTTDML
ncbi:MAG: Na+/H+ antiporter subunit C [Ignavibacteriales bacterium]|nr:Na+/H+ antiporter subunit C [Ignavibacteriales bacterium]